MKNSKNALIGGIFLLGAMLSLSACKKQPTWQDQYDLGMKYLEEGDYEEALASFQAAVAIDDKKTETYTQMLTVYEEQNEESQAEETIWNVVDKVKKEEIAYEDTYDFWENVVGWCKDNDREDLIDEIYCKIENDDTDTPLCQYYMELGKQYAEYYNARLDYYFSEIFAQNDFYLKDVWRGNENMWYTSWENFYQEEGGMGNSGGWDIKFYDDEMGQAVMDYDGQEDKEYRYKLKLLDIESLSATGIKLMFQWGKLSQYIDDKESGYRIVYHYNEDGSIKDFSCIEGTWEH